MSTAAQLFANRANALRSTGPRTEEGKTASSLNSLNHGLASKQLVLPHESREDYEALHASFTKDYKPANATERELVRRMADAWWRLQRAYRVENAFLSKCMEAGGSSDDAMAGLFLDPKEQARMRLFMRYLGAAERAWNKSLADFNQVRRERLKSEKQDRSDIMGAAWAARLDDKDAESESASGFAPQPAVAAAATSRQTHSPA
jgi:hypothetical protein